MINLDLEKHITQQIEQTVKTYLDSEELRAKMLEQVDNSIGAIIENVANRIYSEIVNRTQIADHIKTIINIEASSAIQKESMELVRAQLSNTPIKQILENSIKKEVDSTVKSFNFPEKSIAPESINWRNGILTGSHLKGGVIENFSSTGIEDKAKNVQLTILDDHVVAEGQFTAMNITAADTLTAQNLVLTGSLEIGTEIIDHGPFSQLIQMHAEMVIDDKLEPYKALIMNGQSLLTENTLAPSVSNSNLRRVGNLLELNVSGDAKFSETMFVSAGNKVGINTEEPRGALTVWDEDAEVTFVKTGRKTMFMGSTRDSQIEIGTNNKNQISLTEGDVTVNSPITIMGVRFNTSVGVPEGEGLPNEIRFVTSAREDQPRFYICLGGSKWKSLGH
jgi:REP element-mobilizing transposase RayT